MRASVLAIFTLAALTAGELAQEANASPGLESDDSLTADDFVVPVHVSTTTVEAIAPPETLIAQQFASTPPDPQNVGAPEQSNNIHYYQDYQTVVVPTEAPYPTANPNSEEQPTAFPTPAIAPTSTTPFPQPSAVQTTAVLDTVPARFPNVVTPPELGDLVVTATEVQIVGASQDLQQIVREAIQTRPGGPVSRSQLQSDANAILQTGLFTNVNVTSSNRSEGLQVVYQVEPIMVRSLQLSGAQALTPEVATELFRPQLGQSVSPTALGEGVERVNQWYRQNGYSLAQVVAVLPRQDGTITLEVAEGIVNRVNVRFVNEEGSPVNEEGEPIVGRTTEEFILREIQLEPGQPFREDVAQRDLRQLANLGLFQSAGVSLSGDSRQVDVTYDVVEALARSVNVGGGYNDDTGLFGTINYQDRNIGGVGQQFGVDVQVSRRDLQFDTNFTSPYRASTPDTLGYRVEASRRRVISSTFTDEVGLPNGDDVREGRFGGGVTFLRPLGNWDASLGLDYNRVSIRDRDGRISPVDEFGNPLSFSGTGIDDLATVTFAATLDQRDNPINPTSGSALTLSTEQSIPIGQGNIFGNRLRAEYTQYLPVTLLDSGDGDVGEVIAFNLQGGTAIGDLPPYNAFNLGGSNSVRGYEGSGVGSGRSYVLASAEYRFPILSLPVAGVVFADFGSDLGTGDAVLGEPAVVRDKPGIGFGYGLGVRVQSPLGLIRADYGFNDQGEGRLHFGFGQRF